MTESKVVNRWIKEAENRKEIETSRRFLIRLLQNRFSDQVTPEVVETINTQPSLAMLKDWFDQAARAASFADFVRVLRA